MRDLNSDGDGVGEDLLGAGETLRWTSLRMGCRGWKAIRWSILNWRRS